MPFDPNRISVGVRPVSYGVLLYGPEGIGKTAFAASSKKPFIICAERGSEHLDVARFAPENWTDLMDSVRWMLTDAEHTFETLVIDTVDWACNILNDHICEQRQVKSIEDIPYGKGYQFALDEFRELTKMLDALKDRGIYVIMLAHSIIKSSDEPDLETHDTYKVACDKRIAAYIKQWADAILFLNLDKTVSQEGEGFKKRTMGESRGLRVLYTEKRAAFEAKNRYELPPKIIVDKKRGFGFQQFHEGFEAYFTSRMGN